MKYYLQTYRGSIAVELPEGTTEIVGIKLSGDEILISPVYCDPMFYERAQDVLDWSFVKRWNGTDWEEVEIPEISAIN